MELVSGLVFGCVFSSKMMPKRYPKVVKNVTKTRPETQVVPKRSSTRFYLTFRPGTTVKNRFSHGRVVKVHLFARFTFSPKNDSNESENIALFTEGTLTYADSPVSDFLKASNPSRHSTSVFRTLPTREGAVTVSCRASFKSL